MSLRLPPSIQSIIGPGGRIDPHWERWLGELVRQINTPVQSGGEVAPVEPAAMVQGYGIAVTGAGTQDSPWVVRLREIADSGTGALLGITRDAYGRITGTVDATITGTTGEIDVANGDAAAGVPTLSLADVPDAGGGTLQKTAFDAKGRKTGTSAATTDDLAEGSTNLYFTDERVYTAAKSQLVAGTNVTITPDDVNETLTIAASGGGGGGGVVVAKEFYSSNAQQTINKTLGWNAAHTLVPSDFTQLSSFSYSYTPQSIGNRIRVRVTVPYTGCSSNQSLRTGLIAGGSVVAAMNLLNRSSDYDPYTLIADLPVDSLTPIAFNVGFASAGATNIYVLGGTDGGVFFNGIAAITLELEEYVP